jgi:hypothetical protein
MSTILDKDTTMAQFKSPTKPQGKRMTLAHCPCCDIENAALTPIEAFMLGIGVRKLLDDSKSIAEQMCEKHRMPLVGAIMTLGAKIAARSTP